MSNMAYCRFRNTLDDLRDCADVISDVPVGEEEQRARRHLIQLCRDIVEETEGEEV